MMRTGGQLIVEALEANGVERIFCVPGESYLAVLDALHDSKIKTIVCRQEGGAAMMADCEGRLTGKPGICFVTRGPGATNASAGIHIAMQDFDPDAFVHRSDRRPCARARSVPGGELQALLRRHRQMGCRDRPRRTHSRAGDARLRGGDIGPAGSGGDLAAGGYADFRSRSAESTARNTGRDTAGRSRAGRTRTASGQSQKTFRHSGWHALGRAGSSRHPHDRRKMGAAGRRFLPPANAVRPSPSQLCRRCRHRPEPRTGQGSERGRSGIVDRRPFRRNAVVGLHADQEPLP